ncbi:beta-N-acetylglucosaminidase domain-containing protein [Sphingobium algorifonticola]|uniref:beta-N-acetylglucosaminidase domain-containing protein n=1 Tax=Sphingobium algorifonticola TaxID=2008318 RepID=UPI001F4A0549|nr:beta-N-acetylglucosaminidase domain-containing protein [Sphingobium algorifonticola]
MDRGRVGVIPELGIIEGYFGRCWDWNARATVVECLAPAGYGFFHYAPKIDRYLRRDWQRPYPSENLDALAAFADRCRALGVRFGIGLTPFGAHLSFDADTRQALRAKLDQLRSVGIDDLVIMFDDMDGDVPDLATRQANIVSFCLDHSAATRYFVTPTYYSDDRVLDHVFGQRPVDYLAALGRNVDPAVAIYWTGEEVCARQLSPGAMREIGDLLGRKPAVWDNYPVNDGPRMSAHLHLRAFTGRPASLAGYISHHAINPASQPLLGCIPALTLPKCYTLGEDYRYMTAFRDAAIAVAGPALAEMLEADIAMLQDRGRGMPSDQVAVIRSRYAAIDHPVAAEVVDWLDGGYAITGEMLRTQ